MHLYFATLPCIIKGEVINLNFSEDNYFGYIIKGDLHGALHYIEQFPEQVELLHKYLSIFKHRQYIVYPIDKQLNCILQIYQQYYIDVFFLGIKNEDAENQLTRQLVDFLRIKETTELSDIENHHLTELFKAKGFYFMGGKTSGYYGPYVWKSIETKIYSVELPKGTQNYTINFLDEFITTSWIDYLSFGKVGTGGWTNGDGIINCIKSSYDFNSEAFMVSLLKHEAQHAMDLSNFYNITSVDLEYRAKLVELIYSKERNLLEQFSFEADNSNGNNGHTVASTRIIDGFIKKLNQNNVALTELPIIQIQSIARELFKESELLLNQTHKHC